MHFLLHFPFFQNLAKQFYVAQQEAFFIWLQTTKNAQHGSVLVHLPPAIFHVDQYRKPANSFSNLAFILCTPQTQSDAFALAKITKKPTWHSIFATPALEIWENTSHFNKENQPLRFGLQMEEREFLINTIRTYLTHTIANVPVLQKPLTPLSPRLLEHTDLDVTLWTNGKLRGSIVLQNQPLVNGLKEATLRAARDYRFKPLSASDLPHTAIEINLISPLHIPLTDKEIEANEIYTDKAYRIVINEAEGWYIPAVFNCRPFLDLNTFTRSLIAEKIGHRVTKPIPIPTISQNENFISLNETSASILNLNGPLPATPTTSLKELKQATAHYLRAIQEADGNLPAIINPMQGEQSPFDPVRLAHTIWALHHYVKTVPDQNQTTSVTADKAYQYLGHLIQQRTYLKFLTPYQKALMFVYMHRAALLREDDALSTIITDSLLDIDEALLPFEPILFLQLTQWYQQTNATVATIEKYLIPILHSFEKNITQGKRFELTSYIDLIPCLHTLGTITSNPDLIKKADKITKWYHEAQLDNGSFPAFPGSNYTHTRGSLKILETLSHTSNLGTLRVSPLPWLTTMQYTNKTTYFVKPEWQTKIIGGFRHDAQNGSVWIDASSHLLLIQKTA